MIFTETPNISTYQWANDPTNPNHLVPIPPGHAVPPGMVLPHNPTSPTNNNGQIVK
jgi:hypothetical protein